MRHLTLLLIFIFYLASILVAQPQHVETLSNGNLLIENFEKGEIGGLPIRWYNQKAESRPAFYDEEERSTFHYQIMEQDGNKFLRFNGVNGKHLNFPTKLVEEIDLNKTPVLSWRWRPHQLPEDANEDKKSRNDVAASIYVVFDMGHVLFKKVPKSIVYTWSSTLPAGTELSHFFGNQKIVVVASGKQGLGEWHQFQRNIVDDYRRLFGDEPPSRPLAILILSDGDDTESHVIADYDDIMLKTEAN